MKDAFGSHHNAAISDDDETPMWAAETNEESSSQKKHHLQASMSDEDEQSHGSSTRRPKKARKASLKEVAELQLRTELTTVAGQLKLNPHFTEEEAKLAAKREYNRRNAARSRARSKNAVVDLQQKCDALEERAEQLSRENEILRAKIEFFQKQQEGKQQQQPAPAAAAPSPSIASAVAASLAPAATSCFAAGAPQALVPGLSSTYELLQGLSGGTITSPSALLHATNQMREHALSQPAALQGYSNAGLSSAAADARHQLDLLRQSVLGGLPAAAPTSADPTSTTRTTGLQ